MPLAIRLMTMGIVCLAVPWAPSGSALAASPMDLVRSGFELNQAEADRLEDGLVKKPNDENVRLELLGFYATISGSLTPEIVRKRRVEHILWLVEKDPKCQLFAFAGGAWKIFLKGDSLADPAGFDRVKAEWLRQVKAHRDDENIKRYAASFLESGDPEMAVQLLRELKLLRAVGSLYASRMLGVVALDYRTGDPSAVDESVRDSAYGQRILAELKTSDDGQLVGGAGFWLAVQGGMLYADGRTTWDYTMLSKELLAKARSLDPNTLDWYAVSTRLPVPGERPARVLRQGGAMVKANLRRSVMPIYPESAQTKGIEGVVQLNILIGLDGKIVKALVVSGPQELAQSALDAVTEWEYKPTLLDGKPVFIISTVSVVYRMKDGVIV